MVQVDITTLEQQISVKHKLWEKNGALALAQSDLTVGMLYIRWNLKFCNLILSAYLSTYVGFGIRF